MNRIVGCFAVMAAFLGGLSTTSECAQAPAVRVLSPATATKKMQALKDGQRIDVDMRTARIALTLPNGKELNAYVLMLREPQTGAYWWTYQGISANAPGDGTDAPPLDYLVYFTGDRAVGFTFSRPFLAIREIQGRKSDFTAIQQTAVAEIERNARAIQDGSMQLVLEINIASKIDSDFLSLAGSASSFPQPKVIGVSRSGGQWEVTLEGPNHDFARLTLDDKFVLLSARRQPAGR